MDSGREAFVCPITHLIFCEPVLASDGHFYERESIQQWIGHKTYGTSPVTGLRINNIFIKSFVFNNLLRDFLEKNPHEMENRFIEQKNHRHNISTVNNILKTPSMTSKIIDYIKFDISLMETKNLESFLKTACIQDIIYLIDNFEDLEKDTKAGRLIHFVSRHCPLQIVKYLTDKGIDIECVQPKTLWRPIHHACRSIHDGIMDHFLNLGVAIECQLRNNYRLIHLVCVYCTYDEIMKFLESKPELNHRVLSYGSDKVDYGIKELLIENKHIDAYETVKLVVHFNNLQKTCLLKRRISRKRRYQNINKRAPIKSKKIYQISKNLI